MSDLEKNEPFSDIWQLISVTALLCIPQTVELFIFIFQKADDREKRQEAHRFHFDAMWHALILTEELLFVCFIEILNSDL